MAGSWWRSCWHRESNAPAADTVAVSFYLPLACRAKTTLAAERELSMPSRAELMKELFTGTDSLTRQLTVAEAEREYSVWLWELRQTVPSGFLKPGWEQLKAMMREGD